MTWKWLIGFVPYTDPTQSPFFEGKPEEITWRERRKMNRTQEIEGYLCCALDRPSEYWYSEEMNQIKINAIKNGTFMKAPNGKPSNLNERQWLQVRTEAFKNWFGDWEKDPENASKVIDKNGEPMVVCHCTQYKFNTFDMKYFGTTDDGFNGKGFYFAPTIKDKNNIIKSTMNYGPYKMYCFLNIRKLNIGNKHRSDTPGQYDGHFTDPNIIPTTEIVVVNPTQIKSAMKNDNNFDPMDANIYK